MWNVGCDGMLWKICLDCAGRRNGVAGEEVERGDAGWGRVRPGNAEGMGESGEAEWKSVMGETAVGNGHASGVEGGVEG